MRFATAAIISVGKRTEADLVGFQIAKALLRRRGGETFAVRNFYPVILFAGYAARKRNGGQEDQISGVSHDRYLTGFWLTSVKRK